MEDEEEIKESILTIYPNLIPFDCTKEIINQMERYICKIKIVLFKYNINNIY